jgi:hypothetical protein
MQEELDSKRRLKFYLASCDNNNNKRNVAFWACSSIYFYFSNFIFTKFKLGVGIFEIYFKNILN